MSHVTSVRIDHSRTVELINQADREGQGKSGQQSKEEAKSTKQEKHQQEVQEQENEGKESMRSYEARNQFMKISNNQEEHVERNSNSRAILEENSQSKRNANSLQRRRSEAESENESQSYSKRQREYKGWGYSQVIQTYPEWRVLETYQENYDEQELKRQFPPSSPAHEASAQPSHSQESLVFVYEAPSAKKLVEDDEPISKLAL